MKIAFVISTFPPKSGGMGQVCLDEAQRLSKLGHKITVFTLAYSNDSTSDFDSLLPFKVVRMRPFIRLGDGGWIPQLLFKLKGFDLAHLHYPFYGGGLNVLMGSLIWHISYVVTYHMDAQPSSLLKNIIKKISDLLVSKLILIKAKKVIVVDQQNTKQFSFLNKLSSTFISTIPNAVDTKLFFPHHITGSHLGHPELDNKKILLFVGNLMPVKRLDLVLRALKNLSDPNLVLLVIGGGYEENTYHQLCSDLDISDKVFFMGKITDRKILAQYYCLADATIVSSDYESFSLVALESLSCATPVIASRVVGVEGRIIDGVDGLFFEPNNFQDLANKIFQFYNYPQTVRKQLGENGRKKVAENYSWDKHIEALLKIYQDK